MVATALAARSRRETRATSAGSSTFAWTVRQGNRTGSWKTIPKSFWGSVSGRPRTRTRPSVGARRPATISSSVLFPQPDGPRIEMNSPARTSNDTEVIARTGRPSAAG